jgi:tRNA U38,U39,U40 pseudouridine synthase TruA
MQFKNLMTLPFVRKFRRIKVLKLWKLRIQEFKRFYFSKKLKLNLPILNEFGPAIFDLRAKLFDIEQLRMFVLSEVGTQEFSEFSKAQKKIKEYFRKILKILTKTISTKSPNIKITASAHRDSSDSDDLQYQ